MTSINEMLNKIYSNIINIILKDFEETEKILAQKDITIPMFIDVLFAVAKI